MAVTEISRARASGRSKSVSVARIPSAADFGRGNVRVCWDVQRATDMVAAAFAIGRASIPWACALIVTHKFDGIDSIACICQSHLGGGPFTGRCEDLRARSRD